MTSARGHLAPGGVAAGEAAGIARWLTVHDDLLRGLAHAVSNRLATISALAGMLEGVSAPDPRFVHGLQGDAEQLEGLLQTLRMLPRREESSVEPMLVSDAADAARRLVEHHTALRDVTIRVEALNDVMPVLADATALTHAMAVSLLAATRGLGTARTITLTLATAGDEVQIRAQATDAVSGGDAGDHLDAIDRAAIDWLLAASHGRADTSAPGCGISVTTLQASRRRA
jgi:signal transduction histidine kinase